MHASRTSFTPSHWDHIKSHLQKQYPVLTDIDLIYKQGDLREMMHHLEIKLHKTNTELLKIIDDIPPLH